MKIRTEVVNPEKAKAYLEKNLKNRNLRQNIVNNYAAQMKKGIWLEDNGDTIRISKSGVLLDGQHRLSAIVKAGVSLKVTIAYDIADNAFEFIDIGTARHAGDVLSVSGVKRPNVIASIIKDYNGLKHGVSSGQKTIRLSNHEVLEIYKSDPSKFDFVSQKAMHLYSVCNGMVAPSDIGSYYLLFKDYAPTRVDDFFEKLCTGADLSKNSPVMMLRNKLIEVKGRKDKTMTDMLRHVYFVKTWNAFIQNLEPKFLRYASDVDISPKPLFG